MAEEVIPRLTPLLRIGAEDRSTDRISIRFPARIDELKKKWETIYEPPKNIREKLCLNIQLYLFSVIWTQICDLALINLNFGPFLLNNMAHQSIWNLTYDDEISKGLQSHSLLLTLIHSLTLSLNQTESNSDNTSEAHFESCLWTLLMV